MLHDWDSHRDQTMSDTVKLLVLAAFLCVALGEPTPIKTGFGPGDQDWGWVKVRPGANMFYWLYYTTANVPSYCDRPLVIWLQGGPGGSSTGYGNFAEVGTLHVNGSERQHAWAKHVNILFIDNPVGAGFSYVDDPKLMCKDNKDIAADMMVFLTEFFRTHPEFRKTRVYIVGESYGGKMGVEIAKQLDERIKAGQMDLMFEGIVLVDAWVSPMTSISNWSPLLLATGLIDERSHRKLTAIANDIRTLISKGEWYTATSGWEKIESQVMKETHGLDIYNIMSKIKFEKGTDIQTATPRKIHIQQELDDVERMMNGPVRKALNIPKEVVHGAQRQALFDALRVDFMKPVTSVIEDVLNTTNLDFAVWSGQLDFTVNTRGTLEWVDKLRWRGTDEWTKAQRVPLLLADTIEGFVANAGKFTFYWINRAGHMVPKDNPEASLEVLRRITKFSPKPIY